jgi:predicted aspartyl protease
LLVDTGSSFTTLPVEVLESLGCDVSQAKKRVAIMTGNGIIQAPVVSVPLFNCLGQQVQNFAVVAINLPFNPLTNGLLGMDFLYWCGALIDVKKAEIILRSS